MNLAYYVNIKKKLVINKTNYFYLTISKHFIRLIKYFYC